ncbi:MAG: hypothetical protein JST92_06460 [Deltaproteobacteria bacterium]|nr:hypothetical protein [Deltaproteobacteria bacterium]
MRLSLAAALAVLALPIAAAHATVSVTIGGSTNVYKFGAAECNGNTTVTIAYDLGANYSSTTDTITIRGSKSSSCTANTVDKVYSPSTTGETGTVTVNLADFVFDLAGGCGASVSSASPGVAYFCVQYAATSAPSTVVDSGSITVNYALSPPTAPTDVTGGGGNNLVRASWKQGNSAESIANYDVYVVPTAQAIDSGNAAVSKLVGTTATVTETDDHDTIINGDTYDIAVRARDTYGNTSALTDVVQGTAVAVDDFYNYYVREGGQAEGGGGCTSVPLGPLSLLGLFAFRRRARTRRAAGQRSSSKNRGPFLIGLGFFALLLLSGTAARADSAPDYNRRPPKRLLFALKFDKYDPQVDSEKALNGATPYHDIFGSRIPWRGQLEVDYTLVHFYGSFMLGGTAGFWQNIGRGREVLTGKASGDTTLLNLVPLGLVATYRFDWLADNVRFFPLIPYAQIGLNATMWQSKDATGTTTDSTVPGRTGHGSGWTMGYTTALGLAFSIDTISPGIANEAFIDMGLQRTSVFVEYGWTRLDGFRNGTSLILSDRGPRLGLSLEF